jgi:PIN domain nuclease of toxin-antitoxin system
MLRLSLDPRRRLDGGLPDDPADRIIVATAAGLGARGVTRDRRLQGWQGIDTIW